MQNLSEKLRRRSEMNRVPAMFRARTDETELREKYEPHRHAEHETVPLPFKIRSLTLLSASPSAGKYDSELYYARRNPNSVVELSRESGM